MKCIAPSILASACLPQLVVFLPSLPTSSLNLPFLPLLSLLCRYDEQHQPPRAFF